MVKYFYIIQLAVKMLFFCHKLLQDKKVEDSNAIYFVQRVIQRCNPENRQEDIDIKSAVYTITGTQTNRKILGQAEMKTMDTGTTDRTLRIAVETLNKTLQGINEKTRFINGELNKLMTHRST